MRTQDSGCHAAADVTRSDASPTPAPGGIDCFVGRQGELSEMLRVLLGAEVGAGGIAILEGEPGIGKTRTAEEFARLARTRDAAVLWARCFEGEECPPYGPWIAALRLLVQRPGFPELWETLGWEGPIIAELLPELQRHTQTGEAPVRLPSVDGEHRLHASLLALLRAAARGAPLVVVLDNLHLADAGSLKFLRRLGPDLADSRLMILATFRSRSELRTDQLALVLEELPKTRGFLRLRLDGLCRDDVRELLARTLPAGRTTDALAGAIHTRTDGNPLFVVELVRQMLHEPASPGEAPPLPEGIRLAIERRLQRRSRRCREVLGTASILGRSFDRDVLVGTASGLSPAEVDGALQEAEQAAVVSAEDPALGRYRFVHALVQETLREEIPATALADLHVRAARATAQACGSAAGPRSVEILGHTLEGAAAADADELIRCAGEAAGYAAAHYAPDHALELIDRTLLTWERLGRAIEPRMAELFRLRGAILTDLERPEEARESLVRAFDLFLEARDRQGAIAVALTPAMERDGSLWLASVGGSGRGIAELRERALALAGADSPERAWLLMQRGSRAALREAVSFARRSGDGRLEAMATTLLAYHELDAWEFPACEELLEQTTRMAGRPADPRVDFGCAYTRYWLGVLTGRPDPAGEGLRLMCDLAGRCRSRWLDTIVHRCTADLAAMRGDWAEARRHGEQALALLAESGPVFNHVWVLRVLLHVELYSGNLKAAARRLSALHRLKGEPGPDDLRTTLLGARITGDAGLLAPAPEPVELRSAEGPLLKFLPTPVLEQAAVAAEQRDTSKAPSYLESTRRWRGTYLDRSTDGIIGMLCDVVGRFDEAIEHFERAIALCRRAGYLPELAMTCRQYAETLVRRGGPSDLERAAGLLEEGSGLCATLGMSALGERIREQRELLAGPAVPERARTDGLTPREVEVLRLLARGFTNAEVAERLFISPLTVARHVHNLLEKTGAANRAEAVAYAARSGLVASYRTVK